MNTAMGDFYRKNGYLVVPNCFGASEIEEIKSETARLLRCERGPIEGLLNVGPQMTDVEVLRQYRAVHFPHKLSPFIKKSVVHPGIV